jgi:hypothetical protein
VLLAHLLHFFNRLLRSYQRTRPGRRSLAAIFRASLACAVMQAFHTRSRVWRGRDALPRVRRCTSANRSSPLCLFRFVSAVQVLWTCGAGRAGAHPYRATRGDRRSSHQSLATSHRPPTDPSFAKDTGLSTGPPSGHGGAGPSHACDATMPLPVGPAVRVSAPG